jgi:hypothetical protein
MRQWSSLHSALGRSRSRFVRNPLPRLLVLAIPLTCAVAQQPPTSTSIDPPAGEKLLLELHGDGVQIYTCTLDKTALNWKFQGPEAKLTNGDGSDAGTHYAGPTWKLADSSEVKASAIGNKPAPEAGSIPWLLLKVASHAGTGKLQNADYITRTDTKGGVAPTTGCDTTHQNEQARVPYTATYRFYGK